MRPKCERPSPISQHQDLDEILKAWGSGLVERALDKGFKKLKGQVMTRRTFMRLYAFTRRSINAQAHGQAIALQVGLRRAASVHERHITSHLR